MPASLLRIAMAVCGCAAIAWGVVTLPAFWRSAPLEQIAANILNQIPYKEESLVSLLPVVDDFEQASNCDPRALHSSAIILLRRLEEGYLPDRVAELDRRQTAADAAIRRSLGCSPADPYLWLVLYSVDSARNGARSEYLDYISMSYKLGPREGWIAVQRNRVAMAIFPVLPPDLAKLAVNEFSELVSNRLYASAGDVLLGPGRNVSGLLLASLASVPERQRREFGSELRSRGSNLTVPGIVTEERPWH